MKLKHLGALLLVLAPLTLVTSHAAVIDNGDVRLSIFGSVAPKSPVSASFDGYVDNFLTSAQEGFTTTIVGNPITDPSAYTRYQDFGLAPPSSITVSSSFNSWEGQANPTGAFAGEFGQRIHFGLLIEATGVGVTVNLHGLTGSFSASDANPPGYNSLNFNATFSGVDYTSSRVGVSSFGGNGVLGGGDDTYVTSGSGANPMLAILYVGLGNAFEAYETSPGQSNQQKLDNVEAYIISQGGIDVTGEYSLNYSGGTAGGSITGFQTVHVDAVPEPSAVLLGSVGFILLLRRRK